MLVNSSPACCVFGLALPTVKLYLFNIHYTAESPIVTASVCNVIDDTLYFEQRTVYTVTTDTTQVTYIKTMAGSYNTI